MKVLKPLRYLWCFVPLFRAFGVPVQVHTTWLVFPCGFLLLAFGQLTGWKGVLLGFLVVVRFIGAFCLARDGQRFMAARHDFVLIAPRCASTLLSQSQSAIVSLHLNHV